MAENKQIWDVIVIGTGIAGLSAGMYSGRFKLKTLVVGEMPGGIITTTHKVENYPGILSIDGADMGQVFLDHAKKFGAQMEFSKVTDVSRSDFFSVKAVAKEFHGKALIFATGTEHKKLSVPGEKEFEGKGVSYCALCDAAFFKNKTVCIVGGGDAAAIEALILAEHCKKVYMFVRRDVLRAEPINYKKLIESKNVEIRLKTEIAEIKGSNKVEAVVLKSGETLQTDAVFVAVGFSPLSDLAEKLGVEVDGKGQIKINRDAQTNVAGVFAAGDVCDSKFKQAITGAAEGVTASYSAYQYVKGLSV